MNIPKRPGALLLLAQAICGLAVPFTLLCAAKVDVSGSILTVLRDVALALLLVWVEVEACLVCGRVRKSSAFSTANAKALGRIALALGLAGLLTLLLGDSVVPWLLTGLTVPAAVERLLLPFILLTLAGMLRAVQLLLCHALAMQHENALTI